MEGMTVQERVADISKRSGASEEIVRAVLKAEGDSITESLMRGERSTLIGRVTLEPEMRYKLVPMKGSVARILVKAKISHSIQARLDECGEFKKPAEGDGGSLEDLSQQYPDLLARQIPSLLG